MCQTILNSIQTSAPVLLKASGAEGDIVDVGKICVTHPININVSTHSYKKRISQKSPQLEIINNVCCSLRVLLIDNIITRTSYSCEVKQYIMMRSFNLK